MGLGAGAHAVLASGKATRPSRRRRRGGLDTRLIAVRHRQGLEAAAGAWATGPARRARGRRRTDLAVASGYKVGLNDGIRRRRSTRCYRFPVLVSWDFTCTGDGGFERLMNDLDVGLLGTVDADGDDDPALEVAATGHIALSHRTRRGESNTVWYRGPLSPQPTVRTSAVDGVLPLAHTGDQLRKLVPGRSRGRLARGAVRDRPAADAEQADARRVADGSGARDLFGAARARELADALVGGRSSPTIGLSAAGGRNALEDLVRTHGRAAPSRRLPPDALARSARSWSRPPGCRTSCPTSVRPRCSSGLGADPTLVADAGKTYGVDGLSAVPVPVAQAPTVAGSPRTKSPSPR